MTYIRAIAHANGRDVKSLDAVCVPPVRRTEKRDLLVDRELLDELWNAGIEERVGHPSENRERRERAGVGRRRREPYKRRLKQS